MKINLKSQKGVVSSDAIIAIILIAVFSGLILAISYNIFLLNSSLKRMATVTNFISSIFEHVDNLYYDDVDTEALEDYCSDYFEEKLPNTQITINSDETWNEKGYKIEIEVERFVPENVQEEDSLDLVKTIVVSVTYKLSGKDQEISMTRIKKRENFEEQNKPDFELITLEENENIYPVKKINDSWIVTNEKDSNWYNYKEGIWAVVLITEDILDTGNIIELENYDSLIWVPRYAYNENDEDDYMFTFQSTENYVTESEEGYNVLEQVDTTINYTFSPEESLNGKWIEQDDLEDEYLNSVLPMINL